MLQSVQRWVRHGWLDAADARHLVAPAAAQRLRDRVAASERQHSGQIRICIEGGLPLSYLWRQGRGRLTPATLVRQRAVMMFSKLRVWDTEHNNGVLLYLLLAERAIELVADRGLTTRVDPVTWGALTGSLERRLHDGQFEDGLMQAVDGLSELLIHHFPRNDASGTTTPNELPDEPVFR